LADREHFDPRDVDPRYRPDIEGRPDGVYTSLYDRGAAAQHCVERIAALINDGYIAEAVAVLLACEARAREVEKTRDPGGDGSAQ